MAVIPSMNKGDRIRASWFEAKTSGFSLAGAQTKFPAVRHELTGIVRHIRGDHPISPTSIRVYVDPDGDWKGSTINLIGCKCGHPHVELKPEWILGIVA